MSVFVGGSVTALAHTSLGLLCELSRPGILLNAGHSSCGWFEQVEFIQGPWVCCSKRESVLFLLLNKATWPCFERVVLSTGWLACSRAGRTDVVY